jgi:deazaflavin-dependent oxidoreductase (nitroreductase family)
MFMVLFYRQSRFSAVLWRSAAHSQPARLVLLFCKGIHMKLSRFLWRLIHFGPRVAYAIGLGPIVGRFVLLLTTTGRKSGLPRVTPLVYERHEDVVSIASARGSSADWLRNIQVNPRVRVRLGRKQFEGLAEITTNPQSIADYLQRQFDRNPRAFGAILGAEGLSIPPSRADLLVFAPKRPMVTIHPINAAA